MRFSHPRAFASMSNIARWRRVLGHPHSSSRSLTRSTPMRSMSRFVAVLSLTVIVSAARSHSVMTSGILMTDAAKYTPSGSTASASDRSVATTTAPTRPSTARARSTNRSSKRVTVLRYGCVVPWARRPRRRRGRAPRPEGGLCPTEGRNIGMAIIEFQDVHKWFGPLHVLNGIDLKVDEGEVVVIIGPSGSGKSTLIRTIDRLEPIQRGHLVIDGVAVNDPKTDVNALRRRVGMVFQSFNLFPHLTAAENIMLAPMKVRGMSKAAARQKAAALLKKVGIPETADQHPVRLSGGQQQRVAIARALAMD